MVRLIATEGRRCRLRKTQRSPGQPTDIRYIQKLLGHASLETTSIYTEMNVESLLQVFDACHPGEKRWRERGA
jgi:integrase